MVSDGISDHDLEIARQGATAYEQGKELEDNPYTGDDGMWWSIGWRQSQLLLRDHGDGQTTQDPQGN